MKHFKLFLTFAVPFLFVHIAWIMTLGSFNLREAFANGMFWGIAVMYWLLWVCMLGLLVEEIYKKD